MKRKLICSLTIISLFMITACGKKVEMKEERKVEDLLNDFIKSYINADVELSKKVFPPFYIEYTKKNLDKDYLPKALENDKMKLGEDFKVTYEITSKEKMNDEELKKLDSHAAKEYQTNKKAEECYKLEGTMKFKGSKGEITDRLSTFNYCKYDGTWYIVRIYHY